ncbi:MAG TPA: 2TM domain-containing protein [Gaiellaceae bacterium]|nr:2TM domain-containing protein [Gaiellaceae bacterium]
MKSAGKEVIAVPTGMLSEREPITPPPAPTTPEPDGELREWARKHVERVHRLKRDVAIFLLGMATLTGIWAVVEWQDNGAFERLSDNGNPGDWEPWILYVALVWGFFLVLDVLKVYFDRPTTEAEIDRAVNRIRSPR